MDGSTKDIARAMATSYVSGMAFNQVHGMPNGTYGEKFARVAAHGTIGGAVSAAQGGKFAHGFVGAAFSQTVSLSGFYDNFSGNRFAQGLVAGVVGGGASVASGGKFESGATAAVFGHLFDDLKEGFGKINLLEHEGINGSHTIREHVGKSDEFLLNRMEGKGWGMFTRYKRGHSSFPSLEAANKLVSATLAANFAEIQAFLASNTQGLLIHKDFGAPTGRVAFRIGSSGFSRPAPVQLFTGYGVTALILRNAQMPHGFVVHTSYPTR